MTSIVSSVKSNRQGSMLGYQWVATVEAEKSRHNLFGGRISELFIQTKKRHVFNFRNGKVFLSGINGSALTIIANEAESNGG